MLREIRQSIRYWLAEQPMVSRFRWDHTTWGSTWPFLLFSILCYLLLVFGLKLALRPRKKPLPLGPILAVHNLCVILASLAVFVGCFEATLVEIAETGWIWRRTRRPWALMLCFPLGIRPSGRVFFWSYVFYLTRYHQLFDSVIWVLCKRPLSFLHVFHHVTALCVCFLWLEFSQSLQIVAILTSTLIYIVRYSYFLCRSVGAVSKFSAINVPANCQIVHFALTLLANIVLLKLHFFTREGCNGMGAWIFDAVSNGAVLLLFLNVYVKRFRGSSPSSKLKTL